VLAEGEERAMGVALVTGASRAIALAGAGYDVAIAARTAREGDGRDFIEPDRVLVGSLESTADAIRATGQRVLEIHLDLLDRASWAATAAEVLAEWGRVDVLVNNARHQAHDHKARFIDVEISTLQDEVDANLLAPAVLAKAVLPGMLERGAGTIVNVTSSAGYRAPDSPADQGGWSTSYAMAKGGLQRLAPMIAMELGDRGIDAFNLNPGFVITEKNETRIAALGMSRHAGARPPVPAAVIAWLATDPAARELNGCTINAQPFALERGLCPDWREDSSAAPAGDAEPVIRGI
jgi:NAD(P)-dependent dehydrogenase (short-subunit alcohol dehydrogenase family)